MKAEIRTYRDLIAWQLGMRLAKKLYAETTRMPSDERFGLTMQMRRAAVSIPSNIAEGYARQSRAEYIRFLRIALGSLAELATQLEITTDMQMLTISDELLETLHETDRVLQGLIRSLAK